MDPFLAIHQLDSPLPRNHNQALNFTMDIAEEQPLMNDQTKSTYMTITGTLNEEDDTIFLKVQIANKTGMQSFITRYNTTPILIIRKNFNFRFIE